VISFIENIINSPEKETREQFNEILSDATSNASDQELEEEFGEYDAREIRGLRLAEKKMDETRGRIIAMLDEQYGLETDPVKKREIEDILAQEKRNLKYLNDEHESQIQRIKRIWIDYFKNPDSCLSLKYRIKAVFKLEGLTIGAIITAVIMIFSTLGLSISNALRGSGKTPAPAPEPCP
jgi:hypothetical protein